MCVSLVTGGVYSNYIAAFVEQRYIAQLTPELSDFTVFKVMSDLSEEGSLYLCLYEEKGGGELY